MASISIGTLGVGRGEWDSFGEGLQTPPFGSFGEGLQTPPFGCRFPRDEPR